MAAEGSVLRDPPASHSSVSRFHSLPVLCQAETIPGVWGEGGASSNKAFQLHLQSAAELTILLHYPGGQKRGEGRGDQKYQGEISLY